MCCNRGSVAQINSGDCSTVTVEDYQNFLAHYNCVKAGGFYSETGYSSGYVQARIDLLNAAIADKQASASSCTYTAYIDRITDEVTNIVLTTDC